VYVGVTVTGGSTNDVSYYVGPPLLLKAATDAVLTWKLKPSKQAIKTVVPICFFIPPDAPQNLLASYQKAVAKHPNANNFGALAYERLLVRSPNDAEGYFRQALALKAADPDYDFGFGDIFMCRWSL
jgi:hypothetical protein